MPHSCRINSENEKDAIGGLGSSFLSTARKNESGFRYLEPQIAALEVSQVTQRDRSVASAPTGD